MRQAGDWLPGKQLCQKGPEGSKLSMRQQHALAAKTANSILSHTKRAKPVDQVKWLLLLDTV